MAISDCTLAAVVTFPNTIIQTPYGAFALPVVMIAIAGAESGWDDASEGDWGDGGSTCDGSTSWGLWQIHNVHSTWLINATGSTNPCVWQQWLSTPTNNAQAALAIYEGQGLTAWTTYQTGAYKQYLSQAQTAVNEAQGGASRGAGGSPGTSPETFVGILAGVGIIAALVFGIDELEGWKIV